MIPGKSFRGLKKPAAVPAPLHIFAHRHAAEDRDVAGNINPDHPDWCLIVPKNERVMASPMFIGVVGIVGRSVPSKLE
jgi:hypothetical protein